LEIEAIWQEISKGWRRYQPSMEALADIPEPQVSPN